MRRRMAVAVLGLLLAAGASARSAPAIDYETFTLDNGLQFAVHEDHSIPIVHVEVRSDVGHLAVRRELAAQPVRIVLESI